MVLSVPRVVVIGAVLLAGCGGQTVLIDGRVKFKDDGDVSVLEGYAIKLQAETGGTHSSGTIESSGAFKVSTFGQHDGALPGKHRVAITPPTAPDPDKPPKKPAIPPHYGRFETSGLSIDVVAGHSAVELELEPAP